MRFDLFLVKNVVSAGDATPGHSHRDSSIASFVNYQVPGIPKSALSSLDDSRRIQQQAVSTAMLSDGVFGPQPLYRRNEDPTLPSSGLIVPLKT